MPCLAADWPVPLSPVSLPGRLVRLEPLAPEHIAELLPLSSDPEIWRYLTSRPQSPDGMQAYLDALLRDYASGSGLPFLVRRRGIGKINGKIAGMTRLKSLSREHRKALIGSWYAPGAWGSGCNTEAKLLLLGYGFECLRCLRIEFQVDSRNHRSRMALVKMGAVEEGTLRSYIVNRDGYRRDSVIFSVLDTDWPQVKLNLQRRLEAQIARRCE